MSTEEIIFCSRLKAPELRLLSLGASRERAKLLLALANVVDGQGVEVAALGLGLDSIAVRDEIALLRARGLPEMAGCLCRERASSAQAPTEPAPGGRLPHPPAPGSDGTAPQAAPARSIPGIAPA